MTNETEYIGLWWSPDDVNRKYYGVLKIEKEGLYNLELYEHHEGINEKFISDFNKMSNATNISYTILIGDCFNVTERKGELITLLNGYLVSMVYSFVNHYYLKYRFDTIILGANYENKDEISFDSISIKYPFLNLWAFDMTGIKSSYTDKKNIKIEQTTVEPFNVKINDSIDISIELKHMRKKNDMRRETVLKEDISFKIESKEKLNIDKFHVLRRNIDIIFSLGYGESIYPSSILCHVEKGKTVKLIKSEFISDESFNPKDIHDMLFTFSQIKDRFGDIVSNLISRSEEIETIYNLYLRVVYEPKMNPIFRFLTLAHL